MLFNWSTSIHGPCLVSSLAGPDSVSVIFAWGKKEDGSSVEYRIAHIGTGDERQRLDRATRLAMGHFEGVDLHETGLINLAVDSSSKNFVGVMPAPVA